jgi:Sec63 Brl domain
MVRNASPPRFVTAPTRPASAPACAQTPSEFHAVDPLPAGRGAERSGQLYVTELGRVASHFYIRHASILVFNEQLTRHMDEARVRRSRAASRRASCSVCWRQAAVPCGIAVSIVTCQLVPLQMLWMINSFHCRCCR